MSAQNSLTIAAGVDLPREVILSKVGIVGILKVQGLVARGDGRPALTESGVAVAVPERSMPTFANFLSRLKVTGPQAQMLGLLKVSAYGIQGLAEAMGTTDRSRGFEENVRQLRRLDYVRLEHGKLHLASWLGGLR